MELIIALAIGTLTASGVWLILRPRTYQVVIGLALLSYAVNLFIFSMGRLRVDAAPVVKAGQPVDVTAFADPVPQALVLTAIVIGFATTARPRADRIAPAYRNRSCGWSGAMTPAHLLVVPIVVPLIAGEPCCFSTTGSSG